jgi:hypothetical protein
MTEIDNRLRREFVGTRHFGHKKVKGHLPTFRQEGKIRDQQEEFKE